MLMLMSVASNPVTASEKCAETGNGIPVCAPTEEVSVTSGGVLSTLTAALGPTAADRLPAPSLAAPVAMDKVNEPSPVKLFTRTVGLAVVPFITLIEAA